MARVAPDRAWIVCHGETQIVVRRAVACPLRGRVPARLCLECRYLVTSSGERGRDRSCAVDEPLLLRSADERLSAELQADRLRARLECATGPWQAAVLEQGVDRMVAGQHRRLEGADAATPGRRDGGVEERVAKPVVSPRVGDRDGDLLDTVLGPLQGFEAEVPDDALVRVEGDPALGSAALRIGELPRLQIGDRVARAKEPRSAAVRGERRVEGGDRGSIPVVDMPNLGDAGLHAQRVAPRRRSARVPFDPSAPAARSGAVGSFVTHR
jgi:hypothetical protein